MENQAPRLKVIKAGGISVVELLDKKMLDEACIAQIGEELSGMIAEADSIGLVMDFTNVEHMSSSALGMLITVHKRVQEKNGQLLLCGIRPSIFEVFKITRLDEIFQIYSGRDEAVAAAAPQGRQYWL